MRLIANIIWILLGGFISAITWFLAGILFYVSIIGIPLGRQAFKMAALSLAPFGKEIVYGGGAPSFLANVVWMLAIGLWQALYLAALGCCWCITIIGIPYGLQLFKFAKLSLAPFGAEVRSIA